MAQMQGMQQMAAPERANSLTKLTNLAGAALSMALVIGIGVWGYKLLVRDVSGVPVVRAVEGPMRVQPDDPGGRPALHQGLAVNNVAAEGTAEAPADRLILAPEPLELSLEDTTAPELAAASAPDTVEISPLAEDGEPLTDEDRAVRLAAAEALAEELSDGAAPIEGLGLEAAQTPEPAAAELEGGLGRSLRPQLRPESLVMASVSSDPSGAGVKDVDPASIPVGTRLAQLGAFESAEIARSEWDRLSNKFGDYLEGKDRVIQKATSGGRVFFRLRAMGFADLNDARRFCSALVAERAECIPVVTR